MRAKKWGGRQGGVRVLDRSAPRPWEAKWSAERRHYLEAADGRVVADGFALLWDALLWAQGK